jgi:hypothetical protein
VRFKNLHIALSFVIFKDVVLYSLSMGKSSTKIKLFKKVFREFLDEYSKMTNLTIDVKIKNSEPLNTYIDDVKKVEDSFICRDSDSLGSITLLKCLNLNDTNIKVNWDYLHNMYFIALGEADEGLIKRSQEVTKEPLPETQGPNIMGLLNNPAISNIISELLPAVTKSLEGKDLSGIDPQEALKGLMSGGTPSIGGFDFSELIKQTTDKVKQSISEGKLDLKELKS